MKEGSKYKAIGGFELEYRQVGALTCKAYFAYRDVVPWLICGSMA